MLRVTVWLLVAAVMIFALVGYLLPRERHISRSLTIEASPEEIFAVIDNWEALHRWSPWYELDPTASYRFEGPERGVGATVIWEGDSSIVSRGRQQIVAVDPRRSVTSQFALDEYPVGTTTLAIAPRQSGSRVTYSFSADAGGDLLHRYLGLGLENGLGRDMERALMNLRRVLQSTTPVDDSAERVVALVVDVDGQAVIFVDTPATETFAQRELARLRAFEYVWTYAHENALPVTGPPLGYVMDDATGRFRYRAALPLATRDLQVEAGFGVADTYAGRAVRAVHRGPYQAIGEAHAAVEAFMLEHELEAAGVPWEVYVDDRETTPSAEREFQVFYPLDGPAVTR